MGAFFAAFTALAGLVVWQGRPHHGPARRKAPRVRQSRAFPHDLDGTDAAGLLAFVEESPGKA